jgi:hypothetical protein
VRKTIKMADVFVVLFCLGMILSGCQASGAVPTLAPVFTLPWQVEVSRFEIKGSLNFVESVTQYNGSKIDVTHTQTPDAGNVYLIIEVTIRKTNNQSTASFDWQGLVVKDASGNSYHRLENDTFLEQYQYTPRITGLELRFGENSGWMAYEIPASVAAGQLTLVYTVEEGQQELVLQK